MGVPCPCHWCTSGMTHVWVSDFSHRPLSVSVCALILYYGQMLSVGANGCILGLICYLYICIWWMWLCVQYTSFTTHWGHPSILYLYIWGLPSGYYWRQLSDLICSGHGMEYWIVKHRFSYIIWSDIEQEWWLLNSVILL